MAPLASLTTTTTALGFMMLAALADASPSPSSSSSLLSIYDGSSRYSYVGCYSETTALTRNGNKTATSKHDHDTAARALNSGVSLVSAHNDMQVQKCLDFCGGTTGGGMYIFAGLEYSRECWCAQTLSNRSVKLPDEACDLPCDGDDTLACGGSLKLSLYKMNGVTAPECFGESTAQSTDEGQHAERQMGAAPFFGAPIFPSFETGQNQTGGSSGLTSMASGVVFTMCVAAAAVGLSVMM